MGITQKIPTSQIREGDFIPGLDNAYVIEVDTDTDYVSLGKYSGRLPDGMVLITFNDANGDEGYLILPEEMPVTVERN